MVMFVTKYLITLTDGGGGGKGDNIGDARIASEGDG